MFDFLNLPAQFSKVGSANGFPLWKAGASADFVGSTLLLCMWHPAAVITLTESV